MRLISGPLQRNKKNQSEGDETSEAAEVQNRPFSGARDFFFQANTNSQRGEEGGLEDEFPLRKS